MKTVLINGGSRGIGRAIVQRFARDGWQVAFTYRASHEAAQELVQQTGALALCADSADEEAVCRAVETVQREFGAIGCLVNNAAVSSFRLFTDITTRQWEHTMRVNLTAPFWFCRCVLPDMIRRKAGRIINIASMWGMVGASCEVHYSAAKAGLIGMTKALAKEVGPSGITVNAVAPGLIRTDMNAQLSGEELAALREQTPLQTIGEASDVAGAVVFLASEEARFITGEILNLSGGFIM